MIPKSYHILQKFMNAREDKPLYILQLHRELLKRVGMLYGGHFKKYSKLHINEIRPDGTQITRFTPVVPYEAEAAIEAIYSSYERTLFVEAVDPLILIPVLGIC